MTILEKLNEHANKPDKDKFGTIPIWGFSPAIARKFLLLVEAAKDAESAIQGGDDGALDNALISIRDSLDDLNEEK
jgi:hypothetical protein